MTQDEHFDLAGAFALGALDEAERTAFEAHLAAGCAACRAEVRHDRSVVARLPDGLAPAASDPSTRAQILDLARAPRELPDLERLSWDEVLPGVRLHLLHEDPARGLRACLAWGQPGARTLAHRHVGGDEVILVLRGGLRDEHGEYHAGDVCRSRAGSVHTEEILPGEDCVAYVLYYGALEPVADQPA